MSTDLRSGLASLSPLRRRLLAALVALLVVAFGLSIADTWGWLDGTKDTAALRPGDCVDLIGYADPERLTLSELEPRLDTIATPIRGSKSSEVISYRCVADLRDRNVEPRSLRR